MTIIVRRENIFLNQSTKSLIVTAGQLGHDDHRRCDSVFDLNAVSSMCRHRCMGDACRVVDSRTVRSHDSNRLRGSTRDRSSRSICATIRY